jgi:hypothetical protein
VFFKFRVPENRYSTCKFDRPKLLPCHDRTHRLFCIMGGSQNPTHGKPYRTYAKCVVAPPFALRYRRVNGGATLHSGQAAARTERCVLAGFKTPAGIRVLFASGYGNLIRSSRCSYYWLWVSRPSLYRVNTQGNRMKEKSSTFTTTWMSRMIRSCELSA